VEQLQAWFDDIVRMFTLNFIADERWRFLTNGLMLTLRVTFFALIFGILIGIVVSIVRSTHDKSIEKMRPGIGKFLLIFFDRICVIYLTVIRGTPVIVQLLIFYFVVFLWISSGELIGIIAFSINAGAYIAEIFRSGIMSVDNGQFEAGRSLGLNFAQTMMYIIIPQAFKNILPTLANEFIVLLKETSVLGIIGVQDLTRGGQLISGRTYSAFMPYIAVALIYLALVMMLTWLVRKLERRLRVNER
jgi:ABC-type amino acid transport system permease subunit